ncbi:hypothetical protein HG530_003783 [Fusarium avenaceum]|nr:hypothetical protein HG530_003783 [Fusarium avenaceum]
MLADVVNKLLQEALGIRSNSNNLLKAVRGSVLEGHNTVAVDDTTTVCGGEGNLGQLDSLVDQVNSFASTSDSLEMAKSLADVVQSSAILGQGLDRLLATRNKDGIKHCGPLPFQVVLRCKALGRRGILSSRKDGRATRSDHERKGALSLDGAIHGVERDGIVTISDNDSDTTRLDGRSLGEEVQLAQVLGLLSGVGFGLMVQLEGESGLNVSLLNLRKGVVEELSLGEVVLELLAQSSSLDTGNLLLVIDISTLLGSSRGLGAETVGPVVDLALGNSVSHGTVTVEVHDRADRLVDGQLLPVDAQSAELGILVGEVSALKKGIIRGANTGDKVAGTESNLLGLGEVLVDSSIQLEFTNVANGDKVLGPNLGSIKNVKVELVLARFLQNLDTKLPLGERAVFDGFFKILAMEIGVLTSKLQSFVPY